jgi:ankyrin repeat protein
MRLINVNRLVLEEFHDDQIPAYAILSHTWGADAEELTLQDVEEGNLKPGNGAAKFLFCCQQAKKDGLKYVWIDTCCINKTDLVELSEAINSMFRWYKRASVCYAYLFDVSANENLRENGSEFQSSRWFRRGWTLQELLAPRNLIFYGSDGKLLGTKIQLCTTIAKVTGISHLYLRGISELKSASVAERMSWAAGRETKRKEDLAYCLLGIFDISMPMLYGEGGSQAFFRLQEQIIRNMRDHSILAWGLGVGLSTSAHEEVGSRGLLAAAPSDFANSGHIVPRDRSTSYLDSLEISGGTLRVCLLQTTTPDGIIGILNCGPMDDEQKTVGLHLMKALPGGPEDYTRSSGCHLVSLESSAPDASRKYVNIIKNRDGATTRTGSEGCWFYDDHEFDTIHLELIEVEPPICWSKEQGTIRSVIEPSSSIKPPVLLRLRQKEVESRDFVLMLQLREEGTTVETYHCIATCARDTSLTRIADISKYLSRHLSKKTTASNGWLNIRLKLVASRAQSIYMISLTTMIYQPYMTIDVSWEMKKPNLTLEIEGILHAKGLWDELQHVGYNEDTGDLESILDMPVLTWAFTNNCIEIVKLVLPIRRVGIDAVDGQTDQNLLLWATKLGHESLVQLLLENGANIEATDAYFRTALSVAVEEKHEDIVELLLSKGANVKTEDLYGNQPLIYAIQTGQEAMVRLLLDKGADIEAKAEQDLTPLHIAINRRYDTLVKLLLERGADKEAAGPSGLKPLHTAVITRNVAAVKLLLEAGANVGVRTDNNDTPMHYATKNQDEQITQMLLANLEQQQESRNEDQVLGGGGEELRRNRKEKKKARKPMEGVLPNTVVRVNPTRTLTAINLALDTIEPHSHRWELTGFPLEDR